MSEEESIEGEAAKEESRYELVIKKDEQGFEHLTIDRLYEARLPGSPCDEGQPELPREQLVDLACRIYDTRRVRSHYFTSSLFGEPVWDMLLALYCLPARREKLTVSGLSNAAGVPMTTGLRWSKVMEQKGLIVRKSDPLDRRRVYVRLTDEGDRLMREYLTSIYRRLTP